MVSNTILRVASINVGSFLVSKKDVSQSCVLGDPLNISFPHFP